MTTVTVHIGAAGGLGTTSACIRTARAAGLRAIVVDLDLWNGTVPLHAGVDAAVSLADVAALDAEQIDATSIAALIYHSPLGFDVVGAPVLPELADLVTPACVSTVLTHLVRSGSYDLVLIDAGSRVDATTLAAVDLAHEVIVHARNRDDDITVGRSAVIADLFARAGCSAHTSIVFPRSPMERIGQLVWAPIARVRRSGHGRASGSTTAPRRQGRGYT